MKQVSKKKSKWLRDPDNVLIEDYKEHLKSKVLISPITNCWIWQAGKDPDGYGVLRYYGKMFRANRAAFLEFCGDIKDGKCILHTCHNSSCIQPDHLYQGTHQQNMNDMVQANRASHAEDHKNHKLTVNLVKKIRAEHSIKKTSARQLAKRYDVADTTIQRILRNETWRSVSERRIEGDLNY